MMDKNIYFQFHYGIIHPLQRIYVVLTMVVFQRTPGKKSLSGI